MGGGITMRFGGFFSPATVLQGTTSTQILFSAFKGRALNRSNDSLDPIGTLTCTTTIFMGRRPLHLTGKDKAAANKDSARKYYHSARACETRAVAPTPSVVKPINYRPRSVQGVPRLDDDVKALLPLQLPQTKLYQQALNGFVDPVFGDIQRWKAEPPFAHDHYDRINTHASLRDPSNPSSAYYHLHTRSLAFVLYGDLMRDQQLRDAQRRAEFDAGWEAAMEALRAEILELQEAFARVSRLEPYHPYHYSREYDMWLVYIRWQAHTLNHLYYLKFLA
ncbi:hypothetical protein K438DRAFT_1971093 [Mycena galopus ATCC 62051]|nr:hypothetical protein K438DRAFT_1971093 [Mycena galopus ATCC 62051]